METTGKALVHHWPWAAAKGLMNKNTAAGLRAACAQVLGALENGETVDVTRLNVEDTLSRFQNLKGKKYAPRVLTTYQQRFRQAVASYLAYLQDPGGWKPKAIPRVARAGRNGDPGRGIAQASGDIAAQPLPATGLVSYPFPLREGQDVRLVLPRDLKATEVKRLTAFMATLATDYGVGD